MTSPEARRQPPGDDSVRNAGDAARIAVERLNSALYFRRVSPRGEEATQDVLLSIAASLTRQWLSIAPEGRKRGSREDDTVTRNVGALAASVVEAQDEVKVLRATVDRLIARVDALEDRP